jgi:hypothetical protein
MGLPSLDLNDPSLMPALRNISVGERPSCSHLSDQTHSLTDCYCQPISSMIILKKSLSSLWIGSVVGILCLMSHWYVSSLLLLCFHSLFLAFSLVLLFQCFTHKCLTNEGHIVDPEPLTPTPESDATSITPSATPASLRPPMREIPQGVISLEECLSLFTSEEILDEDNSWYCSHCKTHRQANKMIQLWRLPKVLIIGLKRFETTTGGGGGSRMNPGREKISTFVDFPINGLNVSAYCNQARRAGAVSATRAGESSGVGGGYPEHEYLYDLYGVINHYGRMGFGHYTAFARDWDRHMTNSGEESSPSKTSAELSSTWYSFDDDLIHIVDEKTIKTSAAYILFYRQRER